MSRGLGTMQRRILEALATMEQRRIRNALASRETHPPFECGVVSTHRDGAVFSDRDGDKVDPTHVYSVMLLRRAIATQMGKTHQLYAWHSGGFRKPVWEPTRQAPTNCFQTSFTRALRGLIARQLVRPVYPDYLYALRMSIAWRPRVEYVCKCSHDVV